MKNSKTLWSWILVTSFFFTLVATSCGGSGHGSQSWHPKAPGPQKNQKRR